MVCRLDNACFFSTSSFTDINHSKPLALVTSFWHLLLAGPNKQVPSQQEHDGEWMRLNETYEEADEKSTTLVFSHYVHTQGYTISSSKKKKRKPCLIFSFCLPDAIPTFPPPYPTREPDPLLASGWAQPMGTTSRRLEAISPALSLLTDHALAVTLSWRSEHLPGGVTSCCPFSPRSPNSSPPWWSLELHPPCGFPTPFTVRCSCQNPDWLKQRPNTVLLNYSNSLGTRSFILSSKF